MSPYTIQRRIGPHWTDRKQEPPAGYFTKTTARAWLDETLAKARRGELPGMVRTGTTFAVACDDWLDYKRDRKIKLSTQIDYEHMIDRMKKVVGEQFGEKVRLEDVTPEMVEGFRDALIAEGLSDRTVNKYLTVLHGLFVWVQRRYKLPSNPVSNVERRPHAKRGNIDVFSREEVFALVRAAASKQDGTVYLTAAFTGLRLGELLALRWRDVDFVNSAIHVRQSFTNGRVDTPKSGQERTVPMADEVAEGLASLGRRDEFRGDDDLVFTGAGGGHLAGHELRDRYKAALKRAGLRELRFHDYADIGTTTTSATPSVPTRSAPPTPARSWSGWATRTSRRRSATSNSSRGRTRLAVSRPRSWTAPRRSRSASRANARSCSPRSSGQGRPERTKAPAARSSHAAAPASAPAHRECCAAP